MPKRTVKQCVRPQCNKIYSENEKNKYCMCGALLQLVEIDIKSQKSNAKKQNNTSSSKKTAENSKPKIMPEKKEDSHIKVVDVEEQKQLDEPILVIETDSDFKENDEYNSPISEEIEIETECEDNEPVFNEQEDSEDTTPTKDFADDDDSTDETIENEYNSDDSDALEVTEDDTSDVKGYLYLLLEDDEVEYELSEVTRIGRTTEDTKADIDLTEYAGKDVSRQHVVITREKDGFFIANVSKTHSVRIIDKDNNETAMEYGSKIRLETEVGILLSKKIFLQFVEER